MLAYVALSFLTDPEGHLITDVGGKSATLAAMTERGDWDADLGYWNEDVDPDGEFFPYAHTTHTSDGQWVNTTSLPMIYTMRPFYAAGGAHLALVVPMAGAVVAALAAAALERRLSPGSHGLRSFWLVGLGSPAAVYALDLWEHTWGLAAMAIGAIGVFDVIENRRPLAAAAIAGLGFGLAATMRQEALVYGFVAGLTVLAFVFRRRGVAASLVAGGAMGAAAAVPLVVHTLVEYSMFGGALRIARSAGTVGENSDSLVDKLDTAGLTVVAMFNGSHPVTQLFGVLLAVALVWVTADVLADRRPHASKLLTIASFALFAIVLAVEFRPVPGLLAAAPLATVGAFIALRDRQWLPISLGLAPIPLVLLVQFTAGAAFQWGGRYLLLSGLVLAVTAVVGLAAHRQLLGPLLAASLVITLYGVGWAGARSNGAVDARDTVVAVTSSDEIVVWRNPATAREMGPTFLGRRWLSAEDRSTQQRLPTLLIAKDVQSFVWIDESSSSLEEFDGFEAVGQIGVLDLFEQRLTRFVRVEP